MLLRPAPIGALIESLKRAHGRPPHHVLGGHVLGELPRGAQPLRSELLPAGLLPDPDDDPQRELVLARLDFEETTPYARPLLRRVDLGRDFWLGDATGRALVRVGAGGYAHPDLELHLDGAFTEHVGEDPGENDPDELQRKTYVRTLRTGDPVYVVGRASLVEDEDGASYREAAVAVEIEGENLHIYDQTAFAQLAAWQALPWYRKLSVLVRNR
jgi:hypothetical protein